MKTTKDVVNGFFDAFAKKEGWQSFIADDIVNEGPMPTITGKAAFIQQSQQFLMGMTAVSLDTTIVEGNKVALTASYHMALPTGDTHTLRSIEIWTTEHEKVQHILISFDTASFNKFITKMPQPNA